MLQALLHAPGSGPHGDARALCQLWEQRLRPPYLLGLSNNSKPASGGQVMPQFANLCVDMVLVEVGVALAK